jgi:type VI secretion system protein ImpL
MLAQMQLADSIKQMYFRNGSATPEVDFTWQAPQLDPAIGKLVINIEGQKYEYTPGGAMSAAMKWPGPQPGQVSIAAYDTAGNLISSADYQGDWAFFRALQAANLSKQSDLRFTVTFNFGGRAAKVMLQANNLKNPFLNSDMQRFRCGG